VPDVLLPGPPGLVLARSLGAGDPHVAIVTACDTEPDRLAEFDAGGHDYPLTPFLLGELVARCGRSCGGRGGSCR